MSEKVNERLERILNGDESDHFEFYSFVDAHIRAPIPTTDVFYDPSLKKTNIASERRDEKAIMKPEDYQEYVARPFVEVVPQHCIGKESGKQVAWADMANEMMASARLLPSYKYKEKPTPSDASKIFRTEFLKQDGRFVWWFNGKFRKDANTFRIAIKEIDVSGYVAGDNVVAEFKQFSPDERYDGCLKLMKELYLLHYFKHKNLQHAYFTRSEPSLYRMHIGLPRTIPLLKLSSTFKLQYHWEKCTTLPYVAICILRAVAYLHQCNIVHKNIWVENCFLDGEGNILLGGFENVDIVHKGEEHLILYDMWNVATTILDFVLETTDYRIDFPDPTCIEGYDSLFDKMLGVRSRNIVVGENNNPLLLDDRFGNGRLGYIASLISRQSALYKFLDRLLHPDDCPSADFLLRHYPYTAVAEEDFRELRRRLIKKCHDDDEFGELKIAPFCQERKVGFCFLESVKPRNFSNVLKPKEKKPLRGDIPDSKYQCQVTNPVQHFPRGAPLYATFTMYSDFQENLRPPYQGIIVVGAEHTFFRMFCQFTAIFEEPFAIENGKRKHMQWNLLNSPGRFMLPWDVFRCRTGLKSLIDEAANGVGQFIIEGDHFIAWRGFILCDHPEKVSRRVGIQIENFLKK